MSTAELWEVHFARQDINAGLGEMTDMTLNNASAAFLEDVQPEEFMPVLPIMVAADQERAETVEAGLVQLAKELSYNPPPFWVVLSNNVRPGKDGSKVRDCVQEFQQRYPSLPLSFFEITYPEGMPIGRVKADVTDVALTAIARQHGPNTAGRLVVVNQDIDIVRQFPGLLRRFTRSLQGGHDFVQGNMRHGRDALGRYPNMDRVMFWYDLAILMNKSAFHDNVNAITLRSFLGGGGFNPEEKAFHGIEMQRRAAGASFWHGINGTSFRRTREPGIFTAYSPRRAYMHLQAGVAPTDMWGEGDDFETVVGHRFKAPNEWGDISETLAKEIIADMLRQGNYRKDRRLHSHFDRVVQTRAQDYIDQLERGLFGHVDVSDEFEAYNKAARWTEDVKRMGGAILQVAEARRF